MGNHLTSVNASRGAFQTTRWSVVLTAGEHETPLARKALEELCECYWPSLYSYLRRTGVPAHDSQDLVQGFLVHLFEHRSLTNVSPDKGRFRSFLIVSLKNFLANDRDRFRAQKRGGQFKFVSWEAAQAEKGYLAATAMELTPDKAFERTWATALLEQVLCRLREEYVAAGKGPLYEALQSFLTMDGDAAPYADLCGKLNLGESALKMSIHRLRRQFGELLRAEIAQTVASPEEIDQEIRALFAALRS